MEIQVTGNNKCLLRLQPGECVHCREVFLQGFSRSDWAVPFPLGSVLSRLLHGWYLVRSVASVEEPVALELRGTSHRGAFFAVEVPRGRRFFARAASVAGFSGGMRSLHTRIRLTPTFWLIRRFFFPVFEGPGWVILYSESNLSRHPRAGIDPEIVVGFDADSAFTVRPHLEPRRRLSQLINLFSTRVVVEFERPESVVTEDCAAESEEAAKGAFRRWLEHVLGFLKF